MKTQTPEASVLALLFLKDDKTNYVRGFIKGEDDLVLPEDKSSTLLYEADSNSKPQSGWDLRWPQYMSMF